VRRSRFVQVKIFPDDGVWQMTNAVERPESGHRLLPERQCKSMK